MLTIISGLGTLFDRAGSKIGRRVVAALGVILCAACEAPLDLVQVEAEDARFAHRYDMFQAAAHL